MVSRGHWQFDQVLLRRHEPEVRELGHDDAEASLLARDHALETRNIVHSFHCNTKHKDGFPGIQASWMVTFALTTEC